MTIRSGLSPRSLCSSDAFVARLLAVAIVVVGCQRNERPSVPLGELNGALVGGPELLVLPQGKWTTVDGFISPLAASSIRLLIVDRRPEKSNLELIVSGPTLNDLPLGARLNGRPGPDQVPISREMVGIEIPRDLLSGELDLLALTLDSPPPGPVLLDEIRWSSAGDTGSIHAGTLDSLSEIATFLQYGVAGRESELEGGVLAIGRAEVRIRLPREAGSVRLGVRDLSGQPTLVRARLEDGSADRMLVDGPLPKGERKDLDVESAGGGVLILESPEAAAGDLTLWIQPRFVTRRSRVPTIVLITLDTTRRDALGCYDERVTWTPRLDELAARATLFEHAVSTTSWTLPAHASIFTGQLPREHGAGVMAPALPPNSRTLARRISDQYLTIGVVGGPLLRHTFGVARGFAEYLVPQESELTGASVADQAIRKLRKAGAQPTFLFLNFFDPHFPFLIHHYNPPAIAARAAVQRSVPGSSGRRLLEGRVGAWRDAIEQRLRPTPDEIEGLRLAYAAEIAEMDRQVGRVLDELERSGRFDEALIVVAADHGEMLGERGLYSHAVRLEPELTAVPLIVKFPGQRVAKRAQELVSLIDLFPTILRAAGLPTSDVPGPIVTDSAALALRRYVMVEEHESVVHPFSRSTKLGPHLVGLESRLERAVRWSTGEHCWRRDAGTWIEAACGGPDHESDLASHLRRLPLRPTLRPETEARDIDTDERARLRNLGYL